MKYLILLSMMLFVGVAKANNNLIFFNTGSVDFKESGSSNWTNKDGTTGTTSYEDKNINAGVSSVTYQRRVSDSIYLGATIGTNNLKMISLGYGW